MAVSHNNPVSLIYNEESVLIFLSVIMPSRHSSASRRYMPCNIF